MRKTRDEVEKTSALRIPLYLYRRLSSAQFVSGSKSLALKGSHTLGAVGDRGGIPVFQMQAHMGAKGVVKERMQLMKSYAASMKKIN